MRAAMMLIYSPFPEDEEGEIFPFPLWGIKSVFLVAFPRPRARLGSAAAAAAVRTYGAPRCLFHCLGGVGGVGVGGGEGEGEGEGGRRRTVAHWTSPGEVNIAAARRAAVALWSSRG